jgi:two-component system KDP operon response regulator KdpE
LSAGKILVVDDDPQIRRVMKATLVSHGYEVIEARTGEEGLELAGKESPNLVLLDMNMPGMDGLETCRTLRAVSDVPVIVLTVSNTEKDKVAALDAGGDDYVTKPFGIEELLARIRAALRRSPTSPDGGPHTFTAPGLEIDFQTRRVRAQGKDVRLTPKEFDLLRYLVLHAGKPVTHRLGPRLRRRAGILARLHQPGAEKDRSQSRPPQIHRHRTVGRLPLRESVTRLRGTGRRRLRPVSSLQA